MEKGKMPTNDSKALLKYLEELIGQDFEARLDAELARRQPKPPATKSKDTTAIYQVKVTLRNSQPPIWRRLLVPGKIKLDRLHQVFQEAMGWGGYHMHQFRVGDLFFALPDPEFDGGFDSFNERKYRLQDLVTQPNKRFSYEYDFGDSWDHEVLVEKISETDPRYPRHPVCLKGKGHCPPEDCGGIFGYYEMLDAIKDPKHSEHKSMKEWLGGSFDPDAFDLEEINEVLAQIRI